MSRELARHQLAAPERELFDLRYLDPTADDFAQNVVTRLFATDDDGHARPLVTIYATPVQAAEVQHGRLKRRLDDPGLRSYAPAAAQTGALVPGLLRPIAAGVMAHDGNRDFTHLGSAFVLRTSGSVELVDGDATVAGGSGHPGLYLRHTLIHVAQVLNYLVPYGESIERAEWTFVVNVRDANRAQLADMHRRFETLVSMSPHAALDRHLQFRAAIAPGDEQQARAFVQRLDEYLSFAYGYGEPRGHAASGWLVEQ